MSEVVNVHTGEVTWDVAESVRAESRRIIAAIREEGSLDGLRRLADRAEALRLLAKKAGVQLEYQNEAAYARLCAERELGQRLRDADLDKGGNKDKIIQPVTACYQLDDLGVSKIQSSRWQKVATVPEPDFEQYVELVNSKADELTSAGVRALANRLEGGKGVVRSLTNEWYTPAAYLDAARAVLGGFDLDPASCDEANETVKAEEYFTEEDDGLTHVWRGRVWLNPPYGRIAGDFVEYLAEQYDAGNVTAAVALVNAHCTDTRWFQRLWDHTLCFTGHRIDFAKGTDGRGGSTHGSVFAYLGPGPESFAEEFGQFGAVVRRWP